MKTFLLASLIILSFVSLGFANQPGLLWGWEAYAPRLQQHPLKLEVTPLTQSKATSCGEAVMVMAYNYAYPETPLNEGAVIEYAASNGYYTEKRWPYTSPANMLNIVQYYVDDYTTGNVETVKQGLVLLVQKLQKGQPVIIDVLTRLDDPSSGAHFVLVTGIAIDPRNSNAITIYYNNPLTGRNEAAPWNGDAGVWNAWQKNGDPGGAGWWLVIPPE